ncbi:MAG: ATP-dependent DNA helicase [Lachnospiraceae bacterium]|nr:ATP-dependent DNA helicase [Lachnospiraceae bacterium]
MEGKTNRIRVSVRNFVEFLLRSGDIDERRGSARITDAMLMGSRIHRKIQQSMGGDYRAEVPLKMSFMEEEYEFCLEGRADGIFSSEEVTVIDEIKGMYADVESMAEPIEVHLAQAKCYAYLYAMDSYEEKMGVQLTYCNLDTEGVKRFYQEYTTKELEDWFLGLYREYKKWVDYRMEARKIRQASIKKLSFPYPYRDGQERLVKDVYLSILRKKVLFVEAPTGVGKTLCTVFPAVKAVGEELSEQIFYLTAKTITRTAAAEAFSLLMEKGYRARVLLITAKDKVCPLEERACNPEDCPYAKGYFDRVNDAVFDFLKEEGIFDRDRILSFAEERKLCPFEFSLDVSLWCDAIICDYNYVFDPNVYLKRFFNDGISGDYLFLVDEAHNLIDRGREMYSAVLYKESFLEVKRLMAPHSKRVCRALDKCNKQLLEYKRECETAMELDSYAPFFFSLMQLSGELERFLKENPRFDGGEAFSELYLSLRHFLNMNDIMDEGFTVYVRHDEEGRFFIKLYCMDTANVMEERLKLARSTVFFSATLLPISYYKQMLTTSPEPYAVYAKTCFSKEQSRILVASDVSSRYTRRNRSEFLRIAEYIKTMAKAKTGNYMVFFPSYRFLDQVFEVLAEEELPFEILVQGGSMTEEDREEFLGQFKENPEKSLVGFCVMGGIFSEGINLIGERLIGAILVGTGLPLISDEREILKRHYEESGRNGFDYAFRFPGMNKVLQSAGRVIRTQNDRGVILLLDERFLHRDYQELFPLEWENRTRVTLSTVGKELEDFWQKS